MKKKSAVPQPKKGDPEYDSLLKSISEIAKSIVALGNTAAKTYEPIVNDLINSRCKDHMKIQRTMDYLLDFGGNPDVLQLFKKLCRYYFPMDPAATSDYIGFYLEQYEPEKYKKFLTVQKKAKKR